MKLLGGDWSKGDVISLVGVMVAVVALLISSDFRKFVGLEHSAAAEGSIQKEPVSPVTTSTRRTEPAPTPTITAETYPSDNLPSGAGGDFSPWYTLCSENKPEGWTIADSTFELKGDRAGCAFAECEHTQNSPTKVCWRFRMQGHNEEVGFGHGGNTGIHYSQGFLKVIWKH
jgi:hypothetical protein